MWRLRFMVRGKEFSWYMVEYLLSLVADSGFGGGLLPLLSEQDSLGFPTFAFTSTARMRTESSDVVSSSMELTKRYGFLKGLMMYWKANAESGKGVMNYKIRIQVKPGIMKNKTRAMTEKTGLRDLRWESRVALPTRFTFALIYPSILGIIFPVRLATTDFFVLDRK